MGNETSTPGMASTGPTEEEVDTTVSVVPVASEGSEFPTWPGGVQCADRPSPMIFDAFSTAPAGLPKNALQKSTVENSCTQICLPTSVKGGSPRAQHPCLLRSVPHSPTSPAPGVPGAASNHGVHFGSTCFGNDVDSGAPICPGFEFIGPGKQAGVEYFTCAPPALYMRPSFPFPSFAIPLSALLQVQVQRWRRAGLWWPLQMSQLSSASEKRALAIEPGAIMGVAFGAALPCASPFLCRAAPGTGERAGEGPRRSPPGNRSRHLGRSSTSTTCMPARSARVNSTSGRCSPPCHKPQS